MRLRPEHDVKTVHLKKYVLDAVIGTIETGGESASIPAASVSAVAPVAAFVGGGNRVHPFWPEEHRVDHPSGGFYKICHIPLRLCDYPCSVYFTRLSWTQRFEQLRILSRPSVWDMVRPPS